LIPVYIQPYFPEPEIVPGAVAQAPYDTRLKFIRGVTYGWCLRVAVSFAGCSLVKIPAPLESLALWGLAGLLILSASRGVSVHGKLDRWVSWIVFPPTILMLAAVVVGLGRGGLGTLSIPIGMGCLALYTLLCGRDYSFTGAVALAWMAMVGVLVLLSFTDAMTAMETLLGALTGTVFLFYVVYDLACLLQRRRTDEQSLAVVDLARDSLNFITYGIRVIRHWQRFRLAQP